MSELAKMFEPLQIRHLRIRNRILQTAHEKGYSPEGALTHRELEYLRARARGGTGLLYTAARAIHPSATAFWHFTSGWADAITEADRRVTDALHEEDVHLFAQLNHFGSSAATDGLDELHELWSSSDVASPASGSIPRPMEDEDIAELVDAWATAARRCRDGGFDGVEIQLGHGYLLHQFLSPMLNRRTDAYGGSTENRARFALEVLAAARERVGDDFVLGVRMSLGDFHEGGLEPAEVIEIAQGLHAATRVDFWNLTGPGYHSFPLSLPSLDGPEDGWLAEYSGRFKAQVPDSTVFLVGGIREPARVEEILAAGQADMVALTREQIADPAWVNKARDGQSHQIYHCIRANQGCFGRVSRSLPMACTVNPLAGREALFANRMEPTERPRHWLIAGGGPAGLKAAETLARRGHRVTLCEASDALGGQVKLILRTGNRQDMGWVVRDLEAQIAGLDVDVRLATPLDAAGVAAIGADAVLLATGAVPDRAGFTTFRPGTATLPGHDQPHVVSGFDVLDGSAAPTGRVAVLDDQGTRYSAGVCEVLLDRGCEVVLVSPANALFPQTGPTIDLPGIYVRLLDLPLEPRLNSWATGIDGPAVTVANLYTGREEVIDGCEAVVLVTQRHANDTLYRQLRAEGRTALRIGDCLAPRMLDHAIFDGFVAGIEMDRAEFPQQGQLARWPEEPVLPRA